MVGRLHSAWMAALCLSGCAAIPSLPAERSSFDVDFAVKRIRVWTYLPSGAGPDSRVVFVLHDVLRNGEEYREPWILIADRHGCVVLVPEYSNAEWPGARSYNDGNMHDERGDPLPEEAWTFTSIDAVVDAFQARSGNRTGRYFIFGRSAGGQFLHRMILMKPAARFEIAVPANSGAYATSALEAERPYGLKGTRSTAERLKASLERRVVVLLGENDVDPNDRYLPRAKEAMAQGEHRFARGKRFFAAAREAAARLGADFGWTLQTVPGVGHDDKLMAPAAARIFFETPAGQK